jgi:hypothetical protein
MSDPGPTHQPYGHHDPYGQQPSGQASPYGQPPYGQSGYGQPAGDRRPGTVTAAAWITIVFSALTAVLFGLSGLALVVARDEVINEMERVPEFQDTNIDADAAVGVIVAVILGLIVWALVAIVLAVLVLRRSNVSRILLVISSAVVAVLSLLGVTSGVSLVTLLAALGVIVLLFVGGANEWFKGPSSHDGLSSYGQSYPDTSQGHYGAPAAPSPYGQPGQGDPYGQSGQGSTSNPYGQSGQGSTDNPYGQQPPSGGEGGSDHPNRDYPGR